MYYVYVECVVNKFHCRFSHLATVFSIKKICLHNKENSAVTAARNCRMPLAKTDDLMMVKGDQKRQGRVNAVYC